MRGRRLVLSLVIIVIVLLAVPFKITKKDRNAPLMKDVYTSYESVLWQYTYTCTGIYNDGSCNVSKEITLFNALTIYKKDEKVRRDAAGELVPSARPDKTTAQI